MSIQENDDERLHQHIQNELSSVSFEEIMKLKDKLGAKVYKQAVLGLPAPCLEGDINSNENFRTYKRLNKNRPREVSAKRPVPFLGKDRRGQRKTVFEQRDPRFDGRTGVYNVKKFKENYEFLSNLRDLEIGELKQQLNRCTNPEEKYQLKKEMLRLINKNVEENNWHKKQRALMEEKASIEKAKTEGKQPHYTTKRERHVKQLVAQFEELKAKGKLAKHLERRRKKNAAKDRKKINLS